MVMKSSKEPECCVAHSKSPGAHEHEFTLFLLLAWLIEIRELGLFGGYDSFVRVHLVVEFESVVSVGEVLLGLYLYLRVRCNPVKKFGAVVRVFGVSSLICLEHFITAHFFFLRSCPTPAERPHKIIAANESHGIQHSSTNHNRNTCHALLHCNNFVYQSPFFNSFISNISGEDFLVLEVLFERDAAHHDSSELCVFIALLLGSEVKFSFTTFFATQLMLAAKPVRVAASMIVFNKLVVRHGYAIYAKVQNKTKINRTPPHLSRCQLRGLS